MDSKGKKAFNLKAIYKDGKLISVHTNAKDVNGFEIIGILQAKIMEIHAQMLEPEKFEFNTTRIFTTEEADEYLKKRLEEQRDKELT